MIQSAGTQGASHHKPAGTPKAAPSIAPFNIAQASGCRRARMKMLALTMPMDWTAKLKSRPRLAGWSKSSTRIGNPTVPPPIGVEPAT